jgi:hypothetical protein
MTTFTTFVDGQSVPSGIPNETVTVYQVCDLSLLSSAPVVDDVVQLARIPDNALIRVEAVVIVTADTTCTDFDLGITGVDADGFDTAITMANAINAANTQGIAWPLSGTDALADGYVNINGDDTIDMLIQTANTTGDGKLVLIYSVRGLSPIDLG